MREIINRFKNLNIIETTEVVEIHGSYAVAMTVNRGLYTENTHYTIIAKGTVHNNLSEVYKYKQTMIFDTKYEAENYARALIGLRYDIDKMNYTSIYTMIIIAVIFMIIIICMIIWN